MNAETTGPSRAEIVDEASKWGVGAGILLVALAPLALPILILTLVAVLPLALPVLALGLIAGVIALPVMLARKIGRSISRNRRPGGRQTQPQPSVGSTVPEPSPRAAGQV